MFRKIHSKKAPGVTLADALQKEFGQYIDKTVSLLQTLLNRYPFTVFSLMVLSMLLSGILAFTVMRQKNPVPFPNVPLAGAGPANRMPDLLNAYGAFKQAAYLQSRIEAITRKDRLTAADSIEVINALRDIDALGHQLQTR